MRNLNEVREALLNSTVRIVAQYGLERTTTKLIAADAQKGFASSSNISYGRCVLGRACAKIASSYADTRTELERALFPFVEILLGIHSP